MKVLICEDDEAIYEVISIVVEQMGYEADGCNNAIDFYKKATTEESALLIIDYWLNQVKADGLIKDLRAHATTAEVPILLISAASNLSKLVKKLPVSAALEKPFDLDVLQTKIQSLVQQNAT
jgi:DNA-binding response OmpR family regulator